MNSNLHQRFRAFYDEHAEKLFGYASLQSRNPKDILQQAFLELWKKLCAYPELNHWDWWMRRRIKHRSIDAYDRCKISPVDIANTPHDPEKPDPLDSLEDDQPLPDEILNQPDLAGLVRKAFHLMPEQDEDQKQEKQLIRLYYFSADTCPDLKSVAAEMGIGESLAMKRHRTAKATLKKLLRSLLD